MAITAERVELNRLDVDNRYQRELDRKRVRRIVKNFDEAQLGVLEVSGRNGLMKVIDGQHRLAALKELGAADVNCLVHSELSPQDEARLFVRFQLDRKGLRPYQRFQAQVFADDPEAVAITRIAAEVGYSIGPAARAGRNNVEAVVSLETTYRKLGEEGLRGTLQVIRRCWSGDGGSTNGYFVRGVARIWKDYGDRLSDEVLDRLATIPPQTILRRSLTQAAYGGGDQASLAIAVQLRKLAGVRGRPRKFKKAAA